MSYKTILVHIDSGKNCAKRLEVATNLAKKHDACLVGLHAFFPYAPPGYIMAHMGAEIMVAQKKAAAEEMTRTEKVFRSQTMSLGLERTEWHTAYDDPVYAMSLHSRYADLVVISQGDSSDGSGVDMNFPERLVLAADRPVLILPNTGDFASIGKRIIVAWNATQEATRAITNAIPFLRLADKVYFITINPISDKNETIPCADIVNYLTRHGVRLEVEEHHDAKIGIGNELLSRAADLSADLLIMGCYGHSRVREWVLGGATSTILESMTIPVLMSH
jgi:nucleotide-binding universal stress UspA family protein